MKSPIKWIIAVGIGITALWQNPALAVSDAVIAACMAANAKCYADCDDQVGNFWNPITWGFGDRIREQCHDICNYNYGICIGLKPSVAAGGMPALAAPSSQTAPVVKEAPAITNSGPPGL